MSDEDAGLKPGISTRTMEIVTAALLFAISVMVVLDSYRLGSKWGDDGPQSGYFPFYIGLLLGLASIVTQLKAVLGQRLKGEGGSPVPQFVSFEALKLVLSVLVPAFVYVLGVQLVGIYIASTLYITLFMRWLGHYSWLKSTVIGLAVSVFIFVMFEIWFKVPLFKGTYNMLGWLGY